MKYANVSSMNEYTIAALSSPMSKGATEVISLHSLSSTFSLYLDMKIVIPINSYFIIDKKYSKQLKALLNPTILFASSVFLLFLKTAKSIFL